MVRLWWRGLVGQDAKAVTPVYARGHWCTLADVADEAELSVRELRANLAEVLNAAAVRGQVTYVTNRGRRVAAVVPVHVAEKR